jgi:hypothetical protein
MRTQSLPGPSPDEKRADSPFQRIIVDGYSLPVPQIHTHKDYVMLGVCEFSGIAMVALTIEHQAKDWLEFLGQCLAAAKLKLGARKVELLAVRSDNAGEFRSDEWNSGIKELFTAMPEHSSSRHHHQVGAASAAQLEISKISNHQMQRAGANGTFLAESNVYANALRNVRPVGGKASRWEVAFGEKPDVGHFRTWFCQAYCLIEKEARVHLQPGTVSVKGRFIGVEGHKWVVFAEGRKWVTNHCKFYEQELISKGVPALLHMDSSTQTDTMPEEEAVVATPANVDASPAVDMLGLPEKKTHFQRGLGAFPTRGRKVLNTLQFLDPAVIDSMMHAWLPMTFDSKPMHGASYSHSDERVVMSLGGVTMTVDPPTATEEEDGVWMSSAVELAAGISISEPDAVEQIAEWEVAMRSSGGRCMAAMGKVPTSKLMGPQGEYEMANPTTIRQAKQTPEWAQWKVVIEEHIAKVEREGARAVPLSSAIENLREHGMGKEHISPSLMRLRLKTDTNHRLIKLQARGCLNGAGWDHDAYDMPTTSRNLPPEGARLLVAEAALEDRVIMIGDIPNAYNKAAWITDEQPDVPPVYMHMFEGFEEYTADGELMVYRMTSPHYGAPPSGKCLESKLDKLLAQNCGAKLSGVIDGMYHIRQQDRSSRVGRLVDDFMCTVPRSHAKEDFKAPRDAIQQEFGEMEWNEDPVQWDFGGVRYTRNRKLGTISASVEGKIEECIQEFHPHLVGSTAKVEQVGSKEALDRLVLPPADERGKLSKKQKRMQSEIGTWMWIVEWFVPIAHVVHSLTCVMAYPPEAETEAVLKSLAAYAYANRGICNTFGGGPASVGMQPTARVKLSPLGDGEPTNVDALMSDATWSGDETKSLKAVAIKWGGGLVMARVSTIRAIMPSSFNAEAEALYEATETGDYIGDALCEMDQVPENSTLILQDNEGLVKTVQEKAKGGSKFHRRKIGLILERLASRRYQVVHINDPHQPVDFMTKLVSKIKLRKSINFLYNVSNAVLGSGKASG